MTLPLPPTHVLWSIPAPHCTVCGQPALLLLVHPHCRRITHRGTPSCVLPNPKPPGPAERRAA